MTLPPEETIILLESYKENNSPKDYLAHYGTPRHSGRYPWGSGDNPYQHNGDFLSRVHELKENGLSEAEIAKALDFKSTTALRAEISNATSQRRMYEIDTAKSLREKGYSVTKIGEIMGKNESSIRSLLNPVSEERTRAITNTSNILKEQVDKKGMIEVGTGVELSLGVSDTKLKTSIAMLEEQGYKVFNIRVPQVTNPGKFTTTKVLMNVGDMTDKEAYAYIYKNTDKIKSLSDVTSNDGGLTFRALQYPESISSNRVFIRYKEDGGELKDGVVELRPGVEDISLGNSHYAQVRIAVDNTHYIKGMAMYSDEIPDGYDIVVNSNKSKATTSKMDALKPMKNDPDNPFGALIKADGQSYCVDKDGKETNKLRVINKLREEGDWDEYTKSLSPQFLAKQKIELINRQLNLTYANKQAEFEEIKSLTNPVVKKQLLESFADDCDAAAIHLKAAALPRQSTKVILPVTSLKDNEIYAPSYKNGEHVTLIRYPHGGTFEIPELVVNNNHPTAKRLLGLPIDAVGINLKVASKLSGADFDGDTVVVIPTNSKVKITTSKSLDGLVGFDPKESYPYHEGMKVLPKNQVGKEMGKVSNLITDMTLKGADPDELARAVRHSMVVIDANKHRLDYKQSEIDNGIESLKQIYQTNDTTRKGYGGASTLLSRAKSIEYVDQRKMFYYSPKNIDPETGKKIYTYTNEYKKKATIDPETGEKVYVYTNEKVKEKSRKMAETDDAFTLSSGNLKENAYAAYANKVKALANEARKEWLVTGNLEYKPEANKVYAKEVASLQAKLKVAKTNAPKERMAQIIANNIVKAKKEDNPDLEKDELKKIKSQALAKARVQTGANKQRVDITEKEWEAIQAGAISNNRLTDILKNADSDKVRMLATPKQTVTISQAKQSRIQSLAASGATIAQIAEVIGVSTSTVAKYLKG